MSIVRYIPPSENPVPLANRKAISYRYGYGGFFTLDDLRAEADDLIDEIEANKKAIQSFINKVAVVNENKHPDITQAIAEGWEDPYMIPMSLYVHLKNSKLASHKYVREVILDVNRDVLGDGTLDLLDFLEYIENETRSFRDYLYRISISDIGSLEILKEYLTALQSSIGNIYLISKDNYKKKSVEVFLRDAQSPVEKQKKLHEALRRVNNSIASDKSILFAISKSSDTFFNRDLPTKTSADGSFNASTKEIINTRSSSITELSRQIVSAISASRNIRTAHRYWGADGGIQQENTAAGFRTEINPAGISAANIKAQEMSPQSEDGGHFPTIVLTEPEKLDAQTIIEEINSLPATHTYLRAGIISVRAEWSFVNELIEQINNLPEGSTLISGGAVIISGEKTVEEFYQEWQNQVATGIVDPDLLSWYGISNTTVINGDKIFTSDVFLDRIFAGINVAGSGNVNLGIHDDATIQTFDGGIRYIRELRSSSATGIWDDYADYMEYKVLVSSDGVNYNYVVGDATGYAKTYRAKETTYDGVQRYLNIPIAITLEGNQAKYVKFVFGGFYDESDNLLPSNFIGGLKIYGTKTYIDGGTILSDTIMLGSLYAPTPSGGVCVVTSNSDGSISITPSGFSDNGGGLAGYNVWRATDSSGSNAIYLGAINSTDSPLEYIDRDTVHGVTYYYYITAYNSIGEETEKPTSGWSSATASYPAPSRPTGLFAVAMLGRIDIGWDKIDESIIDYYVIAESTGGVLGQFIEVSSGHANSVTKYGINLPSATVAMYAYKVKAVARNGASSDYCDPVPVNVSAYQPSDGYSPLPPSGVSASGDTDGRITVSWYGSTSFDANRYIVYRKKGGDPSYLSIAEVRHISSGHLHSYTDPWLENGVTYYYRVSTIDNSGAESIVSPSGDTVYSVATDTSVATPTGFSATGAAGAINLSWTEIAEPNVRYEVWRCKNPTWNSSSGKIATVAGTVSGQCYFIDNDPTLTENNTWCYKIRAVDRWGNIGSFTSEVQATSQTVTSEYSVPSGGTCLASGTSSGSIVVTTSGWIGNVVGYNFWRSNNSSGADPIFLGSVATTGATSFTDINTTHNTTYYYNVTAFNSVGIESSLPSTGWDSATATYPSPAKVSGVIAKAEKGKIFVSWNNITSPLIDRYIVLEDKSSSGWTTIAQVQDNQYVVVGITGTASQVGNYRYSILAVSNQGVSGTASDPAIVDTTNYIPSDGSIPSPISSLSASGDTDGRITLTWTASTGIDTTSYRLYRKESTDSTYYPIIDVPHVTGYSTLSYVDTWLKNNTIYQYRASVIDNDGNESSLYPVGSFVSGMATDTSVATPSNFSVTGVTGAINLSWDEIAEPNVRYEVWRCKSATWNSSSGKIATVAGTASGKCYFIDNDPGESGAVTWTYKVRAIDRWGNVGSLTSAASATSKTLTLPQYDVPSGGVCWASGTSSGSIIVSTSGWSGNVVGYNVWRAENASGLNRIYLGSISSTGATSYVDTNTTHGTTYFYTITAFNAIGEESSLPSSGWVSATASYPTPAQVTNLSAKAERGKIFLDWNSITSPPINYYVIREDKASTGWTSIAYSQNNFYVVLGITGTAANVSGYQYSVLAVSQYNTTGTASTTVNPDVSRYTPSDGISPNPITSLSVSGDSDGRITLTWSSGSSIDTAYYRIYRKESTDSLYYPLAEIPHVTGYSTFSYTDSWLKNNTIYQYKISVVDNDYNESSLYPTGDPVSGMATDTSVATPTNFSATGAVGAINLSWDEIAEPNVRYEIWRCKSATWDSTSGKLATVAGTASGKCYFVDNDPDEELEETWSYKLRAVDRWGNIGTFTSAISATSVLIPVSPSGDVTDASGNIKVPFKPSVTGSVEGFTGLFQDSKYMGYVENGVWKTYTDSSGNFYLGGSAGGNLSWNAASNLLNISGNVWASSGIIAGWSITPTGLSSGTVGMNPSGYPFYAGHANPASASFRVDTNGNLYCSKITIASGSNSFNFGSSGTIGGNLIVNGDILVDNSSIPSATRKVQFSDTTAGYLEVRSSPMTYDTGRTGHHLAIYNGETNCSAAIHLKSTANSSDGAHFILNSYLNAGGSQRTYGACVIGMTAQAGTDYSSIHGDFTIKTASNIYLRPTSYVYVDKPINSTHTGTAPFIIASNTVCTNLNADLLDGNHASAFVTTGGTAYNSDRLGNQPSGYYATSGHTHTGLPTAVDRGRTAITTGASSGTVTINWASSHAAAPNIVVATALDYPGYANASRFLNCGVTASGTTSCTVAWMTIDGSVQSSPTYVQAVGFWF